MRDDLRRAVAGEGQKQSWEVGLSMSNQGAPKPIVLDMDITVYLHHRKVTDELERAVEPVTVKLILVKFPNARSVWHLDCVDTEDLRMKCPRFAIKGGEGKAFVMKKAMTVLEERGVNPAEVRGWARWFGQPAVDQLLRPIRRVS